MPKFHQPILAGFVRSKQLAYSKSINFP